MKSLTESHIWPNWGVIYEIIRISNIPTPPPPPPFETESDEEKKVEKRKNGVIAQADRIWRHILSKKNKTKNKWKHCNAFFLSHSLFLLTTNLSSFDLIIFTDIVFLLVFYMIFFLNHIFFRFIFFFFRLLEMYSNYTSIHNFNSEFLFECIELESPVWCIDAFFLHHRWKFRFC